MGKTKVPLLVGVTLVPSMGVAYLRWRTMQEAITEVFTLVSPRGGSGLAEAGVPGMLSDSMGWMSAQVTARWRSEERRKRYLLLPLYLGLFMHAGLMGKERSERIWILGDVMMTHVGKDFNSGLWQRGHVKIGLNSRLSWEGVAMRTQEETQLNTATVIRVSHDSGEVEACSGEVLLLRKRVHD